MAKDWLNNRSEIAKYLGVSRMTLSRWEKHIRLPIGDRATHVGFIKQLDVDKWYKALIEKCSWLEYYTSRRLAQPNVT